MGKILKSTILLNLAWTFNRPQKGTNFHSLNVLNGEDVNSTDTENSVWNELSNTTNMSSAGTRTLAATAKWQKPLESE